MANKKNKVKYGLKNVHWALLFLAPDGSGTFGPIHPWPGAVNYSADQQAGRSVFRADNVDYWVGHGSSSYEGDLECALIPDDFKREVLGYQMDENGVLYEPANPPSVHFALLFQFEGDAKAQRRAFYNCTATPPGESGETTDNDISPTTESLSILATSLYFPEVEYDGELGVDLVKASTGDDTTSAAYNSWFTTVTVPSSFIGASAYTVAQNLVHVTSDFSGVAVAAEAALEINLNAADGYTLGTVIVTMGGNDVTASAYSAGKVTIASVTGNVQITAVASAT